MCEGYQFGGLAGKILSPNLRNYGENLGAFSDFMYCSDVGNVSRNTLSYQPISGSTRKILSKSINGSRTSIYGSIGPFFQAFADSFYTE